MDLKIEKNPENLLLRILYLHTCISKAAISVDLSERRSRMAQKTSIIIFVLLLLIAGADGINPKTVLELLSFGKDIFTIIYGLFQPENKPNDSEIIRNLLEKWMAELNARLTEMYWNIVSYTKLESYFQDMRGIDDVVRYFLKIVRNILEEKDSSQREKMIMRYITAFDQNEMKLNKIDSLLLGDGVFQVNLLDLFTTHVRCSIGDLDGFESYYLRMASGGMAASLAYEAFQNETIFFERKSNQWTSTIANITKVFEIARQDCISKFPALAKEDFENTDSITLLTGQNRKRFHDKSNDVLRIRSMNKLRYRSNDNTIFISNSDGLILSVFNERKRTPTLKNEILSIFDKETQNTCSGNIKPDLENIANVVNGMLVWHSNEMSLKLYILFANDNVENYINVQEGNNFLSLFKELRFIFAKYNNMFNFSPTIHFFNLPSL